VTLSFASFLVKKTPFRKLFVLPSSGEVENLLNVMFPMQWVQVIRGLASCTATVHIVVHVLSDDGKNASF
jgi:hypothetical protein